MVQHRTSDTPRKTGTQEAMGTGNGSRQSLILAPYNTRVHWFPECLMDPFMDVWILTDIMGSTPVAEGLWGQGSVSGGKSWTMKLGGLALPVHHASQPASDTLG